MEDMMKITDKYNIEKMEISELKAAMNGIKPVHDFLYNNINIRKRGEIVAVFYSTVIMREAEIVESAMESLLKENQDNEEKIKQWNELVETDKIFEIVIQIIRTCNEGRVIDKAVEVKQMTKAYLRDRLKVTGKN